MHNIETLNVIAAKIERTKNNQREIYAKYEARGMLPPMVEIMKRNLQRLTDEYNEVSTMIGPTCYE